MPSREKRELDPVRDTAALKALTHPLRIQLLGLLRMDGPATASELAAKTGESSGSTSYHLRVLAKYDFVGEADHRDARERRWQAVHSITTWDNATMDDPVGRAFLGVVRKGQVEHLVTSLARHEGDLASGRLGPEWLEPSGISDLLPRLTPESLTELGTHFDQKLEELTARDEHDPRALQVAVVLAGLPLAPRDPNEAGAERSEESASIAPHPDDAR